MVVLFFSYFSIAADAELLGPAGMTDLHIAIKPTLDEPGNSRYFYLRAENKHHVESGEAALYFEQDIRTITQSLASVGNWCAILPLHLNVKACTASKSGKVLNLYLGRKIGSG